MTRGARRGGPGGSSQAVEADKNTATSPSSADDGSHTGANRTSAAGSVDSERPKLSRAEAGRLGGLRTRELYGAEHYKDIGRQGGAKGGAVTKQRYGKEHYRRIGSLRGKKAARKKDQDASSD